MADNQMVKIVFDFDLGNVPASAKKLSQYLKDNSLDLKFTKASVDGLSASLNQLATAQTKAGTATAAAGNSVKKSNLQWTHLALIVQDLPYGFRGIQNNLPALMGGIAGMAGPIYFVGSAIIALFTIIIAAPVTEEFIFRGMLQNWLKTKLGTKSAIITASACFALFHLSSSQGLGNISLALSLFSFACFLGFIYEKQK